MQTQTRIKNVSEYKWNMSDMAEATKRESFEKELMHSLKTAIKGSGWRKSGSDVFRSSDDLFLNADIRVHSDACKSTFSFLVKPMSIDEIFWDVMQMPENQDRPLSFRASAWFKCPVPRIHVIVVDDGPLNATGLAQKLIHYADEHAATAQSDYELAGYTRELENHEEQISRGNYSTTLFCLYCVMGKREMAYQFAEEHVSGQRECGQSFNTLDKGFFDLALGYLNETKSSPKWKFWR